MCAPWTTRSIECVPKRTDWLAVLPSKNGQSFRGESLYTRGTDCPTPGIRPVLTHRAAVDFDTPHKRAGLTKRGVHILRLYAGSSTMPSDERFVSESGRHCA